jgi:hypothetical protein
MLNLPRVPQCARSLAAVTSVTLIAWWGAATAGCGSAARAGAGDAPDAANDTGDAGDDTGVTGWRSLFNGVDLSGWDRYLGKPSDGDAPLGLENDPRGVFSVVTVDGEPAIRISGEVWGALISQEELGNFDLRAEYRWGTQVWPPLLQQDAGVMYLSTGPLGAVNAGGTALSEPPGSGAFMVSMEYQLVPGDEGAAYDLGPIAYRTLSRTPLPSVPPGWNSIEITVQTGGQGPGPGQGKESRHLLDGETVAVASGFELDWPGDPPQALDRGKIQLQSEGAEIYFRRLEIRSP